MATKKTRSGEAVLETETETKTKKKGGGKGGAKGESKGGGKAKRDEATREEIALAQQVPEADERDFLERMSRFFVGIRKPEHFRAAARETFTEEEFKYGWSLWKLAAGDALPRSPFGMDPQKGGSETTQILKWLDAFENKWFPRVRMMARRVAPAAKRDDFERWVFEGLTQQPFGPAVVVSVRAFLKRVGELEASNVEYAPELFAMIEARGLDAKARGEAEEQLARLEQLGDAGAPPSAEAVRAYGKAVAAQFEALDGLHVWFSDWATTLRSAFNERDQVLLGLALVDAKRGKGGGGEGGGEGGGGAGGGGEGGGAGEGEKADKGKGTGGKK